MRPDAVEPEEKPGSFFQEAMEEFRGVGYTLTFDQDNPKQAVLNAADYGAPQKRERFILIGVREGPPVKLPEPSHGPKSIGGKPYVTLRDVLSGLSGQQHRYLPFPSRWGKYLEKIPEGGCWKDLPPDDQREAMGGAFDDPDNARTKGKKGGRTGFFRRLAWDAPSPTLVDRPNTKACCLCHPSESRPLSIQEYARIQGFPDDWVFEGPNSGESKYLGKVYELIGQATPVHLSQAIASAISSWWSSYSINLATGQPRLLL
jgi:DNA (cytosine-5)-methyltransferase 1